MRHRTGSRRLVVFQGFETKNGPIIIAAGNDRLFAKRAGKPSCQPAAPLDHLRDPRSACGFSDLGQGREAVPGAHFAASKKAEALAG